MKHKTRQKILALKTRHEILSRATAQKVRLKLGDESSNCQESAYLGMAVCHAIRSASFENPPFA